MSSIMGKSEIPTESRSKMFLRSNSFQKLCSLAHPMRLRGFKSNKEALKSVFESLIVTTRGVIQSVTYRILCFLFLTPFTRLLDRTLAASSGEDGGGKFSTVRLILKLTLSLIISTDKASEVKCDNEPEHVDSSDSAAAAATCVDTAVQTETPQEECEEQQQQQFFDCEDDFAGRPSAQELCSRFLENSRPFAPATAPQGQALSLNLIVYGCVLCCFGQLSALAYMLNVANTIPPGLIFLIAALGYIGYVMMRIFFDEYSPSRTDLSKSTTTDVVVATCPKTLARVDRPKARLPPKGIHPLLVSVVGKRVAAAIMHSKLLLPAVPAIADGSPRMSRSTVTGPNRTLLCGNNKTISKMKIL